MSMFNDGVGEQWELGDAIRIPNLDGDDGDDGDNGDDDDVEPGDGGDAH